MMFYSLLGIWLEAAPSPILPKNTARQLDIAQGSNATIELDIVDSLGNPLDNMAPELRCKQTFASDYLFKVVGVPTTTPGRYTISLTPAMTMDWQGLLLYDVWATKSG